MKLAELKPRIGILGGGPSGLFVFKRLVESDSTDFEISVFEKKSELGSGMPYSYVGANEEHITNISGNEVPELVSSMKEWIRQAPPEVLKPFGMIAENFNDYKVVPRLLFGVYLRDQFKMLLKQAKQKGILTKVFLETTVVDVADDPEAKQVTVITDKDTHVFDNIVITTGHRWPIKHEGTVAGYFDSPYPPSKLRIAADFPVAIKGSSLTAIDAIRTLARENGQFQKDQDGLVSYTLNTSSQSFRLVMHSIDGLLPAVRFHLEDSHLLGENQLTREELHATMDANEGFVPLDFIFERSFKSAVRKQDPEFYDMISDMSIEEFVKKMMSLRERLDAFLLFRAEYIQAEKSIKRRESIYWKEALAELSFALNYPAKYLSAEDMMRLKKVLMPLISIVIAFVPQSSCLELLALYDAGVLSLVPVDTQSEIIPDPKGGVIYKYTLEDGTPQVSKYKIFVNATGQPHFMYEEFPFKTLLQDGTLSRATIRFRSTEAGEKASVENDQVEMDDKGDYHLRVPGVRINDHFQVLDKFGAYNDRIYVMAVPYIGGFNPDYSGLDFCEAASERIVTSLSTLSGVK